MKEIYIVGCGGFATEVLYLIKEINKISKTYVFKGFIDNSNINNKIRIGEMEYNVFYEDFFLKSQIDNDNLCFAMGIGDPKILTKLMVVYSKFNFPNLIHPSVNGDFTSIKLGNGNILTAGCNLTTNITIGSFNILNLNVTIGHDTNIENCNVINPGSNVSGAVNIGNSNLIGTGATILQNLDVGSNSILGAASLLTKNLEDNKLAIGVPAKLIKDI